MPPVLPVLGVPVAIPLLTVGVGQLAVALAPILVPAGAVAHTLSFDRGAGLNPLNLASGSITIGIDYSLDGGSTWLKSSRGDYDQAAVCQGGNLGPGQIVIGPTDGLPGDPASTTRMAKVEVLGGLVAVSLSGQLTFS